MNGATRAASRASAFPPETSGPVSGNRQRAVFTTDLPVEALSLTKCAARHAIFWNGYRALIFDAFSALESLEQHQQRLSFADDFRAID